MATQHIGQGRRLRRYGYGASIPAFLCASVEDVIGSLTQASAFSVDKGDVAN
jgi:hypothetical protein